MLCLVFLLWLTAVTADVSPFRIALLVNWIGEGSIPASSRYFLSSVAANANLLDLLLFHESSEQLVSSVSSQSYPNVYLHDLGHNGFSELAASKMGSKLSLSGRDIGELARLMQRIYRAKPKWALEIRPAFGSIFEDYLSGYTHWLYMDMDEILGDLPAWFELEEFTDYHIVTLATGDSHRIYVRGPFTMVNTTHDFVSLIWRQCSYLNAENIMNYFRFRAQHCLSGRPPDAGYRWNCKIIPDEAEFSERVITAPGMRLKIASKSLADPASNLVTNVRPAHIFWVDGAVRFCVDGSADCDPTTPSPFRRERQQRVSMPLSIDSSFPGMRAKLGKRKRVLLPRKDGGACRMDWTRPWGRCLRTSDRRFDLYLIDKFWWKQEFEFFEESEAGGAVGERMIVHFRSWKYGWARLERDGKIPTPTAAGGGRYLFNKQGIEVLDHNTL